MEGEVVRENNRAAARSDRPRRFPAADVRRVRADLGMAVHQGSVPPRQAGRACEGFRTFLRSADPRVRQTNELFLPTMTPPRSEFFANDVIFLGDMPASALSPRFCEMVKEFVGDFGGGLVILAGPAVRARAIGRHAAGRHAAGGRRSARRDSTTGSRSRLQLTPDGRAVRLHAAWAARRPENQQGLGQPGPAALVSAGRAAASAWPTVLAEHPTRHLRRRQDAAAADRHPPLRPGRSHLPGLQRDLAAAAQVSASSTTASSGAR